MYLTYSRRPSLGLSSSILSNFWEWGKENDGGDKNQWSCNALFVFELRSHDVIMWWTHEINKWECMQLEGEYWIWQVLHLISLLSWLYSHVLFLLNPLLLLYMLHNPLTMPQLCFLFSKSQLLVKIETCVVILSFYISILICSLVRFCSRYYIYTKLFVKVETKILF